MTKADLQAAWEYHNATKHSYQSIRTDPHFLDWDNQPIPFKLYPKLEPIRLPEHLSSSGVAALWAVSARGAVDLKKSFPATETVAEIFYLSAGVTKRNRYPGGEILFRAAACTGALYHVDLYLVCGELPGLNAGVYHFGPQDFALRRLREGDYRPVIARASGGEPAVSNAPAIVVCASTYWRNSWKYQARAYRHCFWDNGTILANFLAAASARQLSARVVVGFVDGEIGRLLGLDAGREGALSLVPLGHLSVSNSGPSPEVEPLALETLPLSKSEVDYPAIRSMHSASSLDSAEEVVAWRQKGSTSIVDRSGDSWTDSDSKTRLFPIKPLGDEEVPTETLEEVICRRGSTRQFSRESISFEQLSTMLDRSTRGIAADFGGAEGPELNDLYLIVNAVEGLPPGAYVFNRDRMALDLLKEGDFRREAGYLGLGQEIPADASVDIFFLADLHRIFERWGNRGYRAAQLEASIMGGKLYLAAYAQRLGASGLTFFDDDVAEFFSSHAAGKSVMFLIALGKSAKRRVR